ncbi:MAG: hypothetical protein E7812_12915 [Phenylobacterium sp.]|nr:MAG: hypothetical protein E7812_12915 [Phenylobacterium sp.]
MTTSTIERAYQLARAGRARDLNQLKTQLKADGCRAVDALLAPRSVRGHLEAICAATFRPAAAEGATAQPQERDIVGSGLARS